MDFSALTPLRRHLIAEANHLTNWLLDAVDGALAPGRARTLSGLKSLLRDYLLHAEAALRRVLHILAAELPATVKKVPTTKSILPAHSREGGNLEPKSRRLRPPAFRLS
jgi:hypothetical protein